MNVVFIPILILAGLIIPALLIGIIVLLIKGGPAIRWVFGILLLLLAIGFFGLFSMRAVSRPIEVVQPLAQTPGGVVHIDKNPTVWAEGLEEELTPDVYSSLETAAYGLGTQLHDTIQDSLKNESLKKIVIKERDVTFSVCEQLRRGLSNIYEDIPIVINQDAVSPSPGHIDIELKTTVSEASKTLILDGNTNHYETRFQSPRGTLFATVFAGDDKHLKEVKFDHCLWLYDPEAFRSQIGTGQWAVITSNDTAISKEQARQQVIDSACSYVSEQLEIQGIARKPVTETDLKNHGFIADEYNQRLQGLSGPIWRAALLLDVSPQRIQSLRQQQITVHQIQRKKWAFQIFSLVGMLVLISLLYLLVNTMTKGYYSTRILIIAAIAFLIFLFLFLA